MVKTLLTTAALSANWSFGKMLGAFQKTAVNYVKIIAMIVGIIMVGVGIYQIAKNLISHGKGQTNWVITFLLIIVGGTLALSSGWGVVGNLVKGGQDTLDNMGQGNADTTGNGATSNDPFSTAIIGDDIISLK